MAVPDFSGIEATLRSIRQSLEGIKTASSSAKPIEAKNAYSDVEKLVSLCSQLASMWGDIAQAISRLEQMAQVDLLSASQNAGTVAIAINQAAALGQNARSIAMLIGQELHELWRQ